MASIATGDRVTTSVCARGKVCRAFQGALKGPGSTYTNKNLEQEQELFLCKTV